MKLTTNDVRAVMTLLFTLALTIGFFVGKTPSEVFFGFAGSAITYYFMSPANGNSVNDTNASKHLKQLSSAVGKITSHTVIDVNK